MVFKENLGVLAHMFFFFSAELLLVDNNMYCSERFICVLFQELERIVNSIFHVFDSVCLHST